MTHSQPAQTQMLPQYQTSVGQTSGRQTSVSSTRVAPYFERPLDRWKLALLIPLFFLLLAGAVYRQRQNISSWVPDIPARSVARQQENAPVTAEVFETAKIPASDDTSAGALGQPASGSAQTNTESSIVVGKPAIVQTPVVQALVRTYEAIQPLPINHTKGQAPIMPVTLANPVQDASITQNEVSIVQGTAAPGSTVIVNHGIPAGRGADGLTLFQTQGLGEVQTGVDGRWQLYLSSPLAVGEHQLSIIQRDGQNGLQTTIAPVNFTVLGAGQVSKSQLVPVINSPQSASRLSVSCGTASNHQFSGTAMPGWIIQLMINEQPAGKTRVGINRAWEVTVGQPLAAGSYIARTVLLSPGGEIAAESAPVAFTMHPCR